MVWRRREELVQILFKHWLGENLVLKMEKNSSLDILNHSFVGEEGLGSLKKYVFA